MDKFTFIGTERKTSKAGNDYFMLHFAKAIEDKRGSGYAPLSSRITKEMFEDFKVLDLGIQFICSYQCIEDKYGKFNIIIQQYQI